MRFRWKRLAAAAMSLSVTLGAMMPLSGSLAKAEGEPVNLLAAAEPKGAYLRNGLFYDNLPLTKFSGGGGTSVKDLTDGNTAQGVDIVPFDGNTDRPGVQYKLDGVYDIETIALYVNKDPDFGILGAKVYVSMSPLALGMPVGEITGNTENKIQFDLAQPVRAQYVTIILTQAGAKGGWRPFEFQAFGKPTTQANLLKEEGVTVKGVLASSASGSSLEDIQFASPTDYKTNNAILPNLTDGMFASKDYFASGRSNGSSYGGFIYDLGKNAEISGFSTYAFGDYWDEGMGRYNISHFMVANVVIFASETMEALGTPDSLVYDKHHASPAPSYNGLVLEKPVTARYVAFYFNTLVGEKNDNTCRIYEVEALGRAPERDPADPRESVIRGRYPAAVSLAAGGVLSGMTPLQAANGTPEYDRRLTDGLLNESFEQASATPQYNRLWGAGNATDRFVVQYDLGEVYSLSAAAVYGAGATVSGWDAYLSEEESTLFDPANRVTGDEQAVAGQSTGRKKETGGVRARYAAFVLPVTDAARGLTTAAELTLAGVPADGAADPYTPPARPVFPALPDPTEPSLIAGKLGETVRAANSIYPLTAPAAIGGIKLEKVTDGDLVDNTMISGGFNTDKDAPGLVYDLGGYYDLTRVRAITFSAPTYAVTGVRIYASNDRASLFRDENLVVLKEDAADATGQVDALVDVTARYVGILLTQTRSGYRIQEFEVYGDVSDYAPEAMKVLFVGNSYSANTCRYLSDMLAAGGYDPTVGYLYYPGCTIEQHWSFTQDGKPHYTYNRNGNDFDTTLDQALAKDDWDYIVLQQGSTASGVYSAYADLQKLKDYIAQRAPGAEFVMHQTWAYQQENPRLTDNGGKSAYANQADMFAKLKDAYSRASNDVGITRLIPTGQSWQNARATAIGDTLHDDGDEGCHANAKGSYLAGAAVYETLTGKSILENTFVPAGISSGDLALLKQSVRKAVTDYAAVEGVSLSVLPNKLTYAYGEALDVTGGKVAVKLGSGLIRTVDLTAGMVSGYDAQTPGKQTLTVTCEGKTAVFDVTVNDRSVTGITLKAAPDKTTYFVGEALDTTGGLLSVHYSAGADGEAAITTAMVTGYEAGKAGQQTLTVSYAGFTVTYTVTVKNPAVTGIAVQTAPTKTAYVEGQKPDVSGGKLTVTYEFGDSAVIDMTADMVADTPLTLGQTAVTVQYGGQTTSFAVQVIARAVQEIAVKTQPDKTAYLEGEALDLTGGVLRVTFNDGSDEEVALTAAEVTGYNPSKTGEQTLTVKYQDKTATLTVRVSPKAVTGIEMASTPSKSAYIEGNTLEVAGGRVKVNYNNGTSETVDLTAAMVSPQRLDTVGDAVTITVSYLGQTTSFTVKVAAKAVSSISMETVPDKTAYIVGQTLEVTGGSIRVQYNNGTSEVVALQTDMASPAEFAAPGESVTVTVTYQGQTTSFTVKVADKSVSGITLQSPPAQTVVLPGQALDTAGGKLLVTYDNGTEETVELTAAMLTYAKDTLGRQEVTVTFHGKTAAFPVLVATKAMQDMLTDYAGLDVEGLTLADKEAIDRLESRLNALTAEEKQALPGRDVLEAAIARMAELVAGSTTGTTETTTGPSSNPSTTTATQPESGAQTGVESPLVLCLLLGGLSAGALLMAKRCQRKA